MDYGLSQATQQRRKEAQEGFGKKLTQFAEWMVREPPCEKCEQFYKKRTPKPICGGFKCGKGKVEPLLSEHEDAIFIFGQVRNQAIFVGMEAVPVDLDYNAVKLVMDLYEIENQRECFEKVLRAWHCVAAIDRAKRKEKQKAKQKG